MPKNPLSTKSPATSAQSCWRNASMSRRTSSSQIARRSPSASENGGTGEAEVSIIGAPRKAGLFERVTPNRQSFTSVFQPGRRFHNCLQARARRSIGCLPGDAAPLDLTDGTRSERKSVVSGKSVAERVDLGGGGIYNKTKKQTQRE